MTDTWMFSIGGKLAGVTHDAPEADSWRAHGFDVVAAKCIPASGYAALARQRDELLALLREIEPALKAHAQSYAHACCTTELHPFDAALLDRLAAAIKEKP